jgi:hypothetical protein
MRALLVGSALLVGGSGFADAQTLSVTGTPATMTISGAIAGSQPLTLTNNATTYTVSALPTAPKKITAQINTSMPAGVILTVLLVPPSGATNAGRVALDNIARDVVSNITNALPQARIIEYQLSATVSAGVIPSSTRTVTFTLVNYP